MTTINKYPLPSRLLHWLIAVMVVVVFSIGLWMAERSEANLLGGLTDTLYAWHKAIGFTVLLLMVVRLIVKLWLKAPAYPDSLSPRLKAMAKGAHHLLYLLLFLTPLFGWAGITAFPALITVGGYNLPAMPLIPESTDLAESLFEIHETMAMLLIVLVIGHVAAAIHHMVRKDGMVRRML